MRHWPLRILIAASLLGAFSSATTGEAGAVSVILPQAPAPTQTRRSPRAKRSPTPKPVLRRSLRRVSVRRQSQRRSPLRSSPAPVRPAPSPLMLPGVPSATPVPALRFGPRAPVRSTGALALYTREGRLATLNDVVAASRLADVVFVGEYHDDPGAHVFEKALLEALMPLPSKPPARPLALSLEMFEVDVQLVLSEYTRGLVREKDFLAAARPWNNYTTDYRPLLELARARRVPVVAANAPHRYVMRVGRYGVAGLEPLTPEAKRWIPPSPWPQASVEYDDRFAAFAREALGLGADGSHTRSVSARYMFEAQWLRDLTMAQAIAAQLAEAPGALIVHVNGLFHSQSGQGTVEALRHCRPGVRPLTVAVVRGSRGLAFVPAKMTNLADFVVVSDAATAQNEKR